MQPWQRFWEDRALYTQLMILGMSVHHLDRGYGIRFRFTGTNGVLKGTIGWPDATYSTLQFTSKKMDGYWYEPIFETKWFPDAFIGTMGDLFQAIEINGEASISGTDNLKTLQLVFACYTSAKERRSVKPSDIS